MNQQKTEPRYRQLIRNLKGSRLGKIWNSYIRHYSNKGWVLTKKVLWGASIGAIILLLPLALETTIEGEAQVHQLNSQLSGEINPNVELRPY